MKFYLSLGGALGFLLAFSGSLWAGNDAVSSLRDGTVGCVTGALLLKFFRHVVVSAVQTQIAQPAIESNQAASGNGSHA